MDQIGPDPVLEFVDEVLLPLDRGEALRAVLPDQPHRVVQRADSRIGHVVHRQAALLQRKARVREEAFVEPVKGRVLAALALADADQLLRGGDEAPVEGHEEYGRQHAEDRVHRRDGEGIHHPSSQAETDGGVKPVIQRGKDQRRDELDEEIEESRPPAVRLRADRREQHRHGRADRDAEDDRIGDGEADRSGRRERLQDTDGR